MRFAAVATVRAKDRSSIRSVEEAVKNVTGPVYDKFHLVPDELLRISHRNPNRHSPHRPTASARTTSSDIAGAVYARYEPTAKELYERYETRAEQCAATARRRLLPPAPKAANWKEKYGEKVVTVADGFLRH